MGNNIIDVVILLVAFGLLFGGVLLFAVTVDHRTHCSVEEQFENPGGKLILHYADLDAEEQDVFDRLIANPEQTITDDACLEGVIRYDETYYRVTDWTTIIWTKPPTLASLGISTLGIGLIGTLIRKRVRPLRHF